MAPGNLIIFTGIDGSGKTTLTMSLIERLKKEGINATYLWWFSAENSLLRRTLRSIAPRKTGSNNGKLPGFSPLRTLYQYIVFLDYQRQAILSVWFPLILGRNVICDRYVHDVVLSFAMEFGYPETRTRKIMGLLLKLSPRPDVSFFVDIPSGIAITRKNDIISLEHHMRLNSTYRHFLRDKMIFLDGTKNIEELNDTVWEHISSCIKKPGGSS